MNNGIEKEIEKLKYDISNILNKFKDNTNKINNDVELLNIIKVKYKNKLEPISKISHISLDEKENIIITPSEIELVKLIEDKIKKQNLELSLINMGKYLIILKQQINNEKKIKFIKFLKNELENCKIKIREYRRNIIKLLKIKKIDKIYKNSIESIINESILLIDEVFKNKIKNL